MREKDEFLKSLGAYQTRIVAVSGGPDSMYLLTRLMKEQSLKQSQLIVAHVNHKTRKECEKEAQFLKRFCDQHHLIFEQLEIKEYQKNHFTEEEARQIRIKFFLDLAHKYHADAVLTAHHGDDLVETILMKILRGSTLEGICGIKSKTKIQDVIFYRPLLSKTKQEIIEVLNQEHIPYFIDESNTSNKHIRNRLRTELLPKLKKEDKLVHLKFLKFSQELTEATEYIKKTILSVKKRIKQDGTTDRIEFLKLDPYLQKEYMKSELKEAYQHHITKINPTHVRELLKVLQNSQKNTTLELPEKKFLLINNNRFSIEKKENYPTYCIECKNDVILPNGGILKKIDTYTEKSNYEIHLNSKMIQLPLFITTRKPGMKMQVKNLKGTKKVQRILIDEKIPITQKEKIPIMIDKNGTVLWVLGLKKSQYDLDKHENYDIIYKYERKESKNETK